MVRILIADKLADEGLAALREAPDVQFDVKLGLSPADLAAAVREYDGLIIRSGVAITADVLADPGRLRAIARAGVGIDNVDVEAATRAGVLVMNTPDANTISTAEHTLAMTLALARHVAGASADLKAGHWNRSRYQGTQLAGKTLGIIGLGRVGSAVARRALALEMTVVAFDPFIQGDEALDGRVRVVHTLDDLMPIADFLTIHASLTDTTRGLVDAAALARAKPGLRVVNCARGGIIDEKALADAIRAGRVAGAAIDVFETEPPPPDHPLLALPQVLCTPHLGASTLEAQTAVSTEAVAAIVDYLLREEIRGACNVVGLPLTMTARDKAHTDLAARMGKVLSALCEQGVSGVTLTTYGESLAPLAPALHRFALASLLAPFFNQRLNVINVEQFARQRGIATRHVAQAAARGPTDRLALAVESGGGRHEIEGTVFVDDLPRLLSLDGYPMNLVPQGDMLLIFNDDRPGVIGFVGTTLGDLKVNIADMALSRHANRALMVLKLDAPPPQTALAALAASPAILQVRCVTLST